MSGADNSGFGARRIAVERADREFVNDRRDLRRHADALQRAGHALASPLYLLIGGVAAGFLIGHWRHASKRRRAAESTHEATATARAAPLDTLMRAMEIAAAAMPMLMPLIARRSAEKAVEAVDPDAVQRKHALH